MRIIYIAQYFNLPTEAGAGRHYASVMGLQKRGHQVTVITGAQNYRTGQIPDKYKGKLLNHEDINGIKVIKTYVYANYRGNNGNINVKKRIINHLSFILMATWAGLREGQVELVFASSTPLFVGIPGWLLGLVKNAPFVFEVRDPWPEAVIALGVFKNKGIIKACEALERFIYKKAKRIVAVSDGFRQDVIDKGVSPNKVAVVPHGVDLGIYDHISKNGLKKELGLHDKFVCIYIGAYGKINDLKVILNCANHLRDHKDIFFMFVGDGDEKPNLLQMKDDLKLKNVSFQRPIPKNQVPNYLDMADICLFTLRKEKVFAGMMPNKIFDYLATGKPTIIAGRGDSKKLIEQSQAGFAVEPEDYRGMAEAILQVYQMPQEERAKLGKNGRNFVFKHYKREDLTDKLVEILEDVQSEH